MQPIGYHRRDCNPIGSVNVCGGGGGGGAAAAAVVVVVVAVVN